MIVEPDLRIPDFAKAGADIISVHAEVSSTTHLHRSLNLVGEGPPSWFPWTCCATCRRGIPSHAATHVCLPAPCRSRSWAARPVWC